jgi:hypothetical protein
VGKVIGLEGALQVPQVLLHAYSQDKEGMLVGQVDELGNGSALAVDLLLEGLFPGGACSHTDSQHPEAVGADVLANVLHLAGLRRMDGCLSSKKASVCSSAESSGLRM